MLGLDFKCDLSGLQRLLAVVRVPRLYHKIRLTSPAVFHGSASRRAITQFQMPAMSPTMTEGGIASWKKKEGESFTQGDVLLEIVRPLTLETFCGTYILMQETDKATIDVEAQEDGIMGKILVCLLKYNPAPQLDASI